MRHGFRYLTFLGFMVLVLAACSSAETTDNSGTEPAGTAPTAATAEVLETMDSGGYTYVRLQTADGEIWAAGPVTPVTVGDTIVLSGDMVMTDFHSQSLDRTFDTILFLSDLSKPGEPGAGNVVTPTDDAAGDMATRSVRTLPVVEAGSVPKAEGGYTVAELYAGKTELAGTEVVIIGRVVRYNENIMGKNWLHIKDGSGQAGTDDLTITTATAVQLGDLVLVRGRVTLDKDFGAGYFYDLIIEDAAVTVQP